MCQGETLTTTLAREYQAQPWKNFQSLRSGRGRYVEAEAATHLNDRWSRTAECLFSLDTSGGFKRRS
jgi:hypothetical protein